MRLSALTGLTVSAALAGASLAFASAHAGRRVGLHDLIAQRPALTVSRAQAAQVHATVLPQAAERRALRYEAVHILRRVLPSTAPPTVFVTDEAGYVWGLSGSTIVSYHSDCAGAEGGVVDHKGRLVVACTNTGTVNVYNKGNDNGAADIVLQQDTTGSKVTYHYPADAFEDSKGNIYATNLYNYVNCNPSCTFSNGNIVWWTTKNQTTGSLPSASYTDPNLAEAYFGDIDAKGNVYVDGLSTAFVPEVDEITNITKKTPTATNLNITLNFPGGVYVVSPRSTSPMLSVVDQGQYGAGNGTVTLYSLPYSGTVVTTLTPPQNMQKACDAVAGGYDKLEAHITMGDAGCHVAELGTVASNAWKIIYNIDFTTPIDAAYAHSDK